MREGRNGGKLKSGNTKNVGRKKELPELSAIIANSLGDEKDGVSDAEAILNAMKAKAKKGDVKAADFVFGYAYGKPRQIKHYEEARNEAEMIRWYRNAVEYSRKNKCPLSAPMKQCIAAAYLKLGKAYFEAKYYEKSSEMLAMAEDLSPSLEKEIKKLKESAESRRSKEFWESVRER